MFSIFHFLDLREVDSTECSWFPHFVFYKGGDFVVSQVFRQFERCRVRRNAHLGSQACIEHNERLDHSNVIWKKEKNETLNLTRLREA